MSERTHSSLQNFPPRRSHSYRDSRDKVIRTASELHQHTVDRAQRRFEQQLADSEREIKWAMRKRRDYSSSPAVKLQATQHLENLRSSLNHDYEQLVQQKVDQVERYMNRRHKEERQLEKSIANRQIREAVEETQLQNENFRLQSINQIVREQDAICEEKLAAQKNLFNRLLEEQARRLRAEKANIPIKPVVVPVDLGPVKGQLARMEYEHRELKQLIGELRTDLANLTVPQQVYRSTVHIPHFVVKP